MNNNRAIEYDLRLVPTIGANVALLTVLAGKPEDVAINAFAVCAFATFAILNRHKKLSKTEVLVGGGLGMVFLGGLLGIFPK